MKKLIKIFKNICCGLHYHKMARNVTLEKGFLIGYCSNCGTKVAKYYPADRWFEVD